jgi:hypothetical protein
MGISGLNRERQDATIDIIQTDFSPLQTPTHQLYAIIGFGFSQNVANVIINRSFTNF